MRSRNCTTYKFPPPGPPGPERAEGRRSPSPIAGSSGLQPQVARSSKKRKRAGTPPVVRVDNEEEDTDNEVRRANAMMKTEMANLSSRAVSLQMTLEDYQQGLEESSNLLDMAKRKEEEMRAKHTQELKAAVDKINELQDSENRRALQELHQVQSTKIKHKLCRIKFRPNYKGHGGHDPFQY